MFPQLSLIWKSNLTNAFFSRQDGFLNILYLRLLRIKLIDFFVKYVVHHVELKLLDSLDKSASVVFRNS